MDNIYNIGKLYKSNKYDTIASVIFNTFEKEKDYIDKMCTVWERNVLYYQGVQHLIYNDTDRVWIPKKQNKYRSTTNLIRSGVDSLTSLLTKNRPSIFVFSNSDKSEDKGKAKFQKTLLEAKFEIDNERDKYNRAAKIGCLYGTVYRKDFWNPNKGVYLKYNEVQSEEEQQIYEEISKVSNIESKAKYYQIGDSDCKILTPNQVVPDLKNAVDSLDDGYYIIEANIINVDVVKSVYSKKGEGYTNNAKYINASINKNTAMESHENLQGSTGLDTGGKLKSSEENTVLVLEAYVKPNKDIPNGLMIVVCCGKVLYIKESPYIMTNGNWHPYSVFRWNKEPVRHHGSSLVDDVIEPQKRYNAINTFIVINRSYNAMPVTAVHKGSLIKKNYKDNSPGLTIEFVGQPPITLPGIPVDASIFKEAQEAEKAVKKGLGNYEILSGVKGTGVYSAALYNLMLEQVSSKFSTQIRDFERFIEKSQNLKANIYKINCNEPRPELIRRIKSLCIETPETVIDDFFNGRMSADEINLKIEVGSMLPKSRIAEQNNIKELMGLGFFGQVDPNVNPKGHDELAKLFGIKGSFTLTQEDVERAKWENDLLRQGKDADAVVRPNDNHMIHFNIVNTEMNKKEFYTTNSKEVIQSFMMHMLQHYIYLNQEQKMQLGLNEITIAKLDNDAAQFGISGSADMRASLEQRVANLEGLAQQALASLSQTGQGGGKGATPTPNQPPVPNEETIPNI